MIEIKEERRENFTIFLIIGRLDSSTSPEVEKRIIASIQNEKIQNIVLDLKSCEYLSSAGIRILVHCSKELEKSGGKIVLANVPKPIEHTLYVTGFLPYFKIFESQENAIGALKF